MPRPIQIIPYYSHPHVATYINDNTFYSEDTADVTGNQKPYDTVIVTGADKGIDNKFIKLNDINVKNEIFGRGNYRKYGQPSIQADALLNNQQTNVWFMRVLPKDAKYANLVVFAHYKTDGDIYRVTTSVSNTTAGTPSVAADEADGPETTPGGTTTETTVKVPVMDVTGLKQLEVKFSVVSIDATSDSEIIERITGKNGVGGYIYARGTGEECTYTPDEAAMYGTEKANLDGWHTVPLFYVRSTGRGKYGNKYAIRIQRDADFEYENNLKTYGFGLIERDLVTAAKNYFSGTLVPTTKYNASTVIDDVIGSYSTGSCPIYIKSFEESMVELFEAYRKTVKYNNEKIAGAEDDSWLKNDAEIIEAHTYALNLVQSLEEYGSMENIDQFDPIFGYRMNSQLPLPYYDNLTADGSLITSGNTYVIGETNEETGKGKSTTQATGNYLHTEYTAADTELWPQFVDSTDGKTLKVAVGDTIIVKNYYGTNNKGEDVIDSNFVDRTSMTKKFTILAINKDTDGDGKITKLTMVYDDGVYLKENYADATGADLTVEVGVQLTGGSDGEFDKIKTVKGTYRPPTEAEMKLLLAREQTAAFRGQKDNHILSPSRINLDFIIDANYNVCGETSEGFVGINDKTHQLYANANILTGEDYRALGANYDIDGYDISVQSGLPNASVQNVNDLLNVKKAIFDLNNYRNKNGMSISKELGAGCSIYLDCGLIGLTSMSENSSELKDLVRVMESFNNRQSSIDIGYYKIVDPLTKRQIPVTVGYHIAEQLIPHIVKFGINKPFVNGYSQIKGMVPNSFKPEIDLIDWDIKESLYKSRINYYITMDEGTVVQRSCQNTCQRDASQLLEENNVRVLNVLKKGMEKACRGYTYEWSSPTVRKAYTDTQMDIYRPWIGTIVEDINIYFDANEYERGRMILHCYVSVKFRGINKRVTLEIDINNSSVGGGN